MSTRTITVFSTKGKQKAKIETEVKTWGELKPLLKAEGYDLKSLHATENINRHDLDHADGVLPNQDFTLFLRPRKTKSGNVSIKDMKFGELRGYVKKNRDVEGFIDHLNATGKNFTRLKTEDLRKRIISWEKKAGKTKTAPEKTQVEEVSENAIESVTNVQRVDLINKMLEEIRENSSSDEVSNRVDYILDETSVLREEVLEDESEESEDDRAKREQEERERKEQEEREKADKEETERLAQEAKDLAAGF